MYKIILSLGSNNYAKLNIDKAQRMLSFTFPEIIFTDSIISLSEDEGSHLPFRNVLGVFYDNIPIKELMKKLKTIEFAVGRQSKDKEIGKVIIDIDLLQYGEFFKREEDINKEYIQTLLEEIDEIVENELSDFDDAQSPDDAQPSDDAQPTDE